jgi:hypothetical protein
LICEVAAGIASERLCELWGIEMPQDQAAALRNSVVVYASLAHRHIRSREWRSKHDDQE